MTRFWLSQLINSENQISEDIPFRFLKYQKTEGLGLRVSTHRETEIAVKTALEPIVRRSGDPSPPVMDEAGDYTLVSILREPSSN
jgi:hypothetical protein